MLLRARQFEFLFPRSALVMGIVNVTPDSFSDKGKFFDAALAVAHGEELVKQGADILDIGGESTRPGAERVSELEEMRRVIPVIEALVDRVKTPISIDTMKPAVARAALAAGASIVNDVGANREDDAMWRLVAETGAGYVLMHMQGTPQTMQKNPIYADVVKEVGAFFVERLERLRNAGVKAEQVALDVGIGFGKTLEHNLQLLTGLESFTNLDRPLMIGVSRKSFLRKLEGAEADLLMGERACTVVAKMQGAALFRTHEVEEVERTLRFIEAFLASRK